MPARASGLRAVVFDLDETLLDTRRAWQYSVEESIAMVCNRRVSAEPLVTEYRTRPWQHVMAILVDSPAERERCCELCVAMFERSGMKRLLVHEGIGMGLDSIRGVGIEMGVISRRRHAMAIKQIQSTGIERFLAVLSATPTEAAWDVRERFGHCLRFLEYEPAQCAYVSTDRIDMAAIAATGACCFEAGWASAEATGFPVIPAPGALQATLLRGRSA